jgi:transposase
MNITTNKSQMNALNCHMKKSINSGDFSTFQKTQALLFYFDSKLSMSEISLYIDKSYECIRLWVTDFILYGIKSLKIKRPRGRQPKLTKTQLKQLKMILSCSPIEAGYSGGCWNAAMIADLIKQLFNVIFSIKYLPQLLKRLRLSYQKAKFKAAKADPKKRQIWLDKTWPKILAKAKKTKSMILFGDEASFALWGSLGYTWSPIGVQPEILTNGNRKNLKVFGMIDLFSGKFIYQIIDDKLNGSSYVKFLKKVIKEGSDKIIIIQDGASYHRSKEVKYFVEDNSTVISTYQLPSYSPDFNPIEMVWRKIKRNATHNVFFEDFESLKKTLKKELLKLKRNSCEILNLFGKYI